jgi:hypothetical protein
MRKMPILSRLQNEQVLEVYHIYSFPKTEIALKGERNVLPSLVSIEIICLVIKESIALMVMTGYELTPLPTKRALQLS